MSNKKAPRGTVTRVLGYLKGYRLLLALSLLLTLCQVALTLYLPVRIGNAIDLILGQGNVDFTGMLAIFADCAVIILASALFSWLVGVTNNKMTFGIVRNIRNDAFTHLQRVPFRALDRQSVGDLVSRLVTDVDQFSDGLLLGFTQLFGGVLTILGTLVFMLLIDVKITLVVVLVTPISLFVASFIAKRTYKMFRRQSELRGRQTALLEEVIGQGKLVSAFGQGGEMLSRFDEINEQVRLASLDATFYSSITNPSTRFVNGLVYAGVALVGALLATPLLGAAITVGELSCFLSYANQYTKPFNEISGVFTELQGALACAARIFEVLDLPAEEQDPADAVVLCDPKGEIVLDGVSFSYTPDKPLIQHLSVKVKAGMQVAIVGPTGCGKTTVINLLMRFYDVDRGEIRIDGIPTGSITRRSLRESIGMVLQDTVIFSGTVRENIAFGRPDATTEEIEAAARAAHAHSFIRRLANGYDTKLGEGGVTLSEGQKQLLSIARLMLSPTPILILDEATSSIDTRTEQKISRAFAALMEGRTTFVVAHRLSTIMESDLILVMRDGNVIEQGTHGELLAAGGFYRDLFTSQFKGPATSE